jgi:hypothetical protein
MNAEDRKNPYVGLCRDVLRLLGDGLVGKVVGEMMTSVLSFFWWKKI